MSSRTPGGRRPRRALPDVCLLAVLALVAVPLAACGKKGDPAPPLRHIPATTEGLTVSQRGWELLLEMPYPTTTTAGQALSGLERVEVYRLLRPVPAADLDLLEAEPGDEAPAAPESAPDGVDTDEQVDEDEPPEPDDDDSQMAAELGIVAADEADQVQAQLEVAEEFAEASEQARAAAQAEAEAAAVPGTDRASRRRQLLAAADPRELRGAELVLAFAGDDLASAVVGGELVLRLPLPQPLPEAPAVHRYAVRTVAGVETSAFSNQAAIVPRTPPPPPRGLDAEARGDGVQLTWEPQDDGIVVGYNVYRRLVTARWFEVPVAVPSPDRSTYLDRGAAIGGSYIYAVTAVAQRQPLIESAVAEVQEVDYRDRFAPPTPASLVALAEEGRVRLVWEGSEADDLAGYRVLRRRGAEGGFAPLTAEPQTNTEYVDRTPEAGVTYTYRVVAVDRIGNESEPAETSTEAR